MTETLRILDANGEVAFDLNDRTGTANPRGLRTVLRSFVLHPISPDLSIFSPDVFDGGFVTSRRRPLRQAEVTMRVLPAESHADIVAAVSELQRLLDADGEIEWIPPGGDRRVLRHVGAEHLGSLWRGQEFAGGFLLRQLQDPEGATFPIIIQPLLVGEELGATDNALLNATLLYDSNRDGRPNDWAWSATTGLGNEAIDGVSESYAFTITDSATARFFRQLVAGAAPGEQWSFRYEGKVSGVGRLNIRIEYLTSGDSVLVAHDSTPLQTPADFAEIAFTAPAAPATTAKVRASIRCANSSGTGVGAYHVRRAKLVNGTDVGLFTVGAESVRNDPAANKGRWFLGYNPGDAPAPAVLDVKGDAGAAMVEVLAGLRSTGGIVGGNRIADLVNETGFAQLHTSANGWSQSFGDATSSADAQASAGTSAITTAGSVSTHLMRVRLTRTTKLDSLRGRSRVFVRWRFPSAVPGRDARFQLRWAASLANPALHANPVTLDVYTAEVNPATYMDTPLGEIYIPEEGPLEGIALELWAHSVGGGAAIRMDTLHIVPIEGGLGYVRAPVSNVVSVVAREMATPPFKLTSDPTWIAASLEPGGYRRLDQVNKGVGVPPNTGRVLGAFRHQADLRAEAVNFDGDVNFRVVNVTDNLEVAKTTFIGPHDGTRFVWRPRVEWDGVAGKAYQAQAVCTRRNAGRMEVYTMDVGTVRSVAEDEAARIDGEQIQLDKVTSDDEHLHSLEGEGHLPFIVPPGLFAVPLSFADVASHGSPRPTTTLDRTPTVSLGADDEASFVNEDIRWYVGDRSVRMRDDWECDSAANHGHRSFRGAVPLVGGLEADQGAPVIGYRADDSQLWAGEVALPPTIRDGMAHIQAHGGAEHLAQQGGRLFYQRLGTDGFSPSRDEPFASTFSSDVETADVNIEENRVIFLLPDGEAWTSGQATGVVLWVEGGLITRYRFTIRKNRNNANFDIRTTRFTGPDGARTLIADHSLGSPLVNTFGQTISGPEDAIAFRVRANANHTPTGRHRQRLSAWELWGRTTSDEFTVSQVLSDIFGSIGFDTSRIESSGFNVLPLDWTESWPGLADYVCDLDDRWWMVTDRVGGTYRAESGRWERTFTVSRQAHAREELEPQRLYTRVVQGYRLASTQRREVVLDADPSPLPGQTVTFYAEDLADAQANATLATAVAQSLLAELSAPSYRGRVTIGRCSEDGIPLPGNAIVPGTLVDIFDHEPTIGPQRVVTCSYRRGETVIEVGQEVSAAHLIVAAALEEARAVTRRQRRRKKRKGKK